MFPDCFVARFLQPKLAVFSVMQLGAATLSAKEQFMQLVPAYLDVTVRHWHIGRFVHPADLQR